MISISNFEVQAPASAGVIGKANLVIASEFPADSWARERLLDEAFGAARSGNQLWFGWTAGTDDNFIMAAASV